MEKDKKVTALYCRLSKDDGSNSESLSIRTQKSMLMYVAIIIMVRNIDFCSFAPI